MEELLIFMMGFILVILVIGAIGYIVNALVYMKLGEKCNVDNYWVAWIPYGSYYIGTKVGKLDIKFFIATIIASIATFSTEDGISVIFSLILIGLIIYIDRSILERFGKNKNLAFLHLILGIGSLIVFIIIATLAFGAAKPEEWEVEDQLQG